MKALLFLSLFVWGGFAQAYQLTCGWVFSEQVEIYLQSNSPQRILKAIEDYKKIMKLTEFNHKPGSMDQVKVRLQQMTPAEKKDLVQFVGSYYNEVKALKYNTDGPFKTFKRHIDLVISQEINAPKFFREQIYKKGLSLEAALDNYYKKVQELTQIPVVLSGTDVLLTALRLQYKFLAQKDDTIVIYGSFVNGKAYSQSSDLDFAVISPQLLERMEKTDMLALLPDFPLSEAQAHTVSAKQVHSLGSMNPLVMLVRKNHIVLRVYENGLHQDFLSKKVPFEEFYF